MNKDTFYTYKTNSRGVRNSSGTFFIIGKIKKYDNKRQKAITTVWKRM